jgi:2-methylcitrate dehydratase PrpD
VENGAITINMKDGRTVSGRTKPAKGSPKNPMTYEDVAEKFRANAEFAKWPAQKAEFIIEQVKSMEEVSDVSKLTWAFTS